MAETQTPTLTEFLLARIAEDEARVDTVPDWYCTESARGTGWGSRGDCQLCGAYTFDGTEDVTEQAMWEHLDDAHGRARVLAECAAKRRIVERMQEVVDNIDGPDNIELSPYVQEDLLRILATPYADHPDYLEEWRP